MVMDMFVGQLHAKVIHVDASEQFLGHLKGVSDPEAKRKIIGREFVEVFQREAKKLPTPSGWPRARSTPTSSSGGAKTKKATTIKSHHNVGGLPETLGLKLLEPLRDLFKDEVRELGVALGLPHEMVYRHPFPGPGLGVRILGEVKRSTPTCCAAPTPSSSRNCAPSGRGHRQELVRPDQPGLRRLPAGQERGRDGRRPHLRLRGGAARGADQRLHDRRLGRAALCAAEEGVQPHHQRGARHQPRHLRREQQAAGDDRVGEPAWSASGTTTGSTGAERRW
jgi:hypothetical protein